MKGEKKHEKKVADQSFGLRLKQLRDMRDWSQGELAEKLRQSGINISQGMISKYEELVNTPRQRNELAIIKFFGLTKVQFYGDSARTVEKELRLIHKLEAFLKLYKAEDDAIGRYKQDRFLIYQEIKKLINNHKP